MTAVAVPRAEASRLVVSGALSNSSLRFSSHTGAFQDTMVPPGSGGLTYPEGMTVGPDGHLYIRSAGNVLRYHGVTGESMGVFASAGGGADPNNQSFQIRFDQSQGNFVVTPASGGLDGPTGLAFGPDGHLYVSSYGLVLRYHGQTGLPLGTFASGGGLVNATGLAFGADGYLYVSCFPGNKVLRYNSAGQFIGEFVTAGSGGLDRPIGLTFGPGGDLFVCSFNTNQVLRYDGLTGAFKSVAAAEGGLDGPTGLGFGPDGNLYVTSYNTDAVLRFNSSTGAFIDFFVAPGDHGIDGPFTPLFVLERPTDLTTTIRSFTRIDLAWTDNSEDETGFEIERMTAGGSFAPIAVVGPGSTSYMDNSLIPNTTYTYRVRGVYLPGGSVYSNESTRTTPGDPPAIPTDLAVALGPQPQELRLTWTDNSGNELKFEVFRTTAGSSYQLVATLGANTTSYTDTALTPGIVWTYKVRSANGGGASNFSNEASGTPLPPPPAAPTGLLASAASPSQINLTWKDNSSGDSSETAFALWRQTGAGDFVKIATLPANTTGYNDTGLAYNTAYTYRLRATNEGGASAWSNDAAATTPNVPPAAPTTLAATAMSPTHVDLSWTDNADNEFAFALFRKTGDGVFERIAVLAPDVVSYSDTSASPLTAYSYQVRATNDAGASAWSNTVSVTTPAATPATPTGLTATAMSPTRVDLSWTDNADNEFAFALFRKTGDGVFERIAVLAPDVVSYSDTGASPNTAYAYQVRATNDAGASAWSNTVSVTTPAGTPTAPTLLTAAAVASNRVNLTWKDNSNNETLFEIWRKVGTGSFTRMTGVGANGVSYADMSVQPNTTYTYQVRAMNDAGPSAFTNEATVTTPDGAPAAPTSLVATAAWDRISLTWKDNSNNERAFAIFRKTGSGAETRVAVVVPDTQAWTDTSVQMNTTYSYRIRATNNVAASDWTNTVTVTTPDGPPAAPTSLTATASGATLVNLTWKDNSSNERAFAIFRKSGSGAETRIAVCVPNTQSYSDTTVVANTTYSYRLRATNNVAASEWTNTVTVTTPVSGGEGPPAAPTSLAATAAWDRISLTWKDNSNNERAFAIFRKTGSGAETRVAVVVPDTQAWTDTSVQMNTTYSYRIRATNNVAASEWTNTVTVTTPDGPPAAPTSLVATVASSTRVNLAWKDNSSNERAFAIFRKSSSGVWERIAICVPDTQSYADTTASPNTTYTYRLRATNNVAASAWTNEVTVTTPP